MWKILKRWFAFLLAVSMTVSMLPAAALAADGTGVSEEEIALPETQVRAAAASSGTCGENLTWELSAEGVLTISGTGEMTEKSWNTTSMTAVVIEEGVTGIIDYAFSFCDKMTSVSIPDSVTSIGNYAFQYCSSLTEVTVPGGTVQIGDYAFNKCSVLASAVLQEGVETIGNGAFNECGKLVSIKIPESVSSIGSHAFSKCECLADLILPSGLTSLGGDSFSGCKSLVSITIPAGVTSIDAHTFKGCSSLEQVAISGQVTDIGQYAFCDCSSLAGAKLPESVANIGAYAFSGCSSLEHVNIPENVTVIGEYAFQSCRSLNGISIPAGVSAMGDSAFSGCELLKTAGPSGGGYDIEFGWTEKIPENAFDRCDALVSVVIPEGITAIGKNAFDYCTSLSAISIPGSVASIGTSGFEGCTGLVTAGPAGGGYNIEFGWTERIPANAFRYARALTGVVIPEGITQIDNNAFYYCSALTDVSLPGSLTSIGGNAFYMCGSLERVVIPDSVATIAKTAFSGCSLITLEVLLDSYAEEFAKNNGINYEYSTVGAKILQLTVSDEGGEPVSGGYTVKWYHGDEKIGTGNRVTVSDGITRLTWTLELEESLAFTYYQPEAQEVDASETQEFSCTLYRIPSLTVTGRVADSEGRPLAGAQVTLVQTADGGYVKETGLTTDEDGRYSAEILNLPTVAEISADGCFKRSLTVIADRAAGNVDAGTDTLSKIPENKVTMTLNLTRAAAEGETGAVLALTNTNGLEFALYNETQKKAVTDFTVQYPYLILGEGEADGGDTIRASVNDNKKTMTAEPAAFTLDDRKMGKLELDFIQNGSFTADLAGASSNSLLVFDENGKFVSRTSASSAEISSGLLPAGAYQAVFMQKTSLLAAIPDISRLADFGLSEGRDYVKADVVIKNGAITELGDISVPEFDESRLYYTESGRTSVTANKSTVVVGNMVQIRAEYEIKSQYPASGQNVSVEIPEGVQFVQNSVAVNGKAANYIYEDQRVTVYTNSASGIVRFCVIPEESGVREMGGALNFTLDDGREVTQPVGTAHFTAAALTLEAPERTGKKEITVTGKARANSRVTVYDNYVQVGTAKANAAGSWSLEFELVNPYTYSYHSLYAEVENEIYEKTLVTDTATVIYQAGYLDVSRVTMYNISHGVGNLEPYENVTVFDFEHPGKHESYLMWPGKYTSFTFVIDFAGDASLVEDVVLHVFAKSGEVRSYHADYDSGKNAWTVHTNYYNFADAPVNVGVDYSYEPPVDMDYSVTACPEAEEGTRKYLEYFDSVFEDLIDVSIKEETEEGLTLFFGIAGYENLGWEMTVRELDYSAFSGGGLESQGFALCEADDPSEKPQYIKIAMSEDEVVYTLVDAEYEYAYSYTVPASFSLPEVSEARSARAGGRTYENMNVWARILWEMTENAAPGVIPQLAAELDYSYLVQMLEEKSLNAKAREEYLVALMTLKCSSTGNLRLPPAALAEAQSRYQALLLQESYTYRMLNSELDLYMQKIINSFVLNALTDGVGTVIENSGKTMRVLKNSKNAKYTKYIFRSEKLRERVGQVGKAVFDLSNGLSQYIAEPIEGFFDYFDISGSQYWLDIRKAYLDLDILYDALEDYIRSNYQKCSDEKLPEKDKRKGPDVDKTPIVDPSGYVCEAVASNRLEGVSATLYYLGDEVDEYGEPTGNQVEYEWDAADYDQANPLVTDANGSYAWDVPEGQWRVKYEKEGYETVYSEWLPVPPPQTEVNVAMVSSAAPEVSTVNAYRDNVRITFTQYMDISSVSAQNVTVTSGGNTVAGAVTPYDEEVSFADESVSYARTFLFLPDRELSGEVEISVRGAVNYAGTAMENTYRTKCEAAEEPDSIEAADSIAVGYGSQKQLLLQVLPEKAAKGLVVTARSTSPSVVSVEEECVAVGEDGRAVLTLSGNLPGSGEIMLAIDGTDVAKTVTAEVVNGGAAERPVCAKVTASAGSGSAVAAGTKISLFTETEGAEIYYTLDGSCPCTVGSPSRMKYTGPITITGETFLIAYAVKEGYEDSATAAFLYYISEEKNEKPDEGKEQPDNLDNSIPKTALKEGAAFTGSDGSLKYKVVKASDGKSAGQVQVLGLAKERAKVNIPASVTAPASGEKFQVVSIAAKAFKGSRKITSVVIGKNTAAIGANAFYGCRKLKAVTLGTGVRTVGSRAFCKCAKLKKITIKSAKLNKIGKNAISGIYKKAVIKVPAKKLKIYNKKFNKKTGRTSAMKVTK